VLKTYPEALRALETQFGNAFGLVAVSEEHWFGNARRVQLRGRYTFASRWPFLAKVTSTALVTTMKDEKPRAPRETVFCVNGENCFWLVREEGKSEFTRKRFPTQKEERTFVKNQMASSFYSYLHAPFSLGGASMNSIIADGGAHITRVSSVRRDDKTHLKIEFDMRKAENKRLRNATGWVVVAPEEKWVIHDYQLTNGADVYRGRVEYAQPQGGFPVPRRVVAKRSDRGAHQPTSIETYEFIELHFGDVPDSEFQLSAFGLREARRSP
jgi:hypothetical protein